VVASSVPSGLNATPNTAIVWPTSSYAQAPVATSHSRGVTSALTVATRRPSGLNGAANTASV
jgi:hypothetical protein